MAKRGRKVSVKTEHIKKSRKKGHGKKHSKKHMLKK